MRTPRGTRSAQLARWLLTALDYKNVEKASRQTLARCQCNTIGLLLSRISLSKRGMQCGVLGLIRPGKSDSCKCICVLVCWCEFVGIGGMPVCKHI